MKNNEKAITLIALIITVIVMMILVGVTVGIAVDGGIFEKAKKAAFQTEIRQIQEAAVVQKTIVMAQNGGQVPNKFNFTLNDLDLDSETKTRYQNKLTIIDGDLYYNEEYVTAKEKQWLEELGVLSSDEQEGEEHVFLATTSVCDSLNYSIIGGVTNNLSDYNMPDDQKEAAIELKEIAKQNNLCWDDIQTLINGGSITASAQVQDAILDIVSGFTEGQKQGITVILGMQELHVTNKRVFLQDWGGNKEDITSTKQVISLEEFNKNFTSDINASNNTEFNYEIMITGYKGTASHVITPSFVWDENNNLYRVEKIAAGSFVQPLKYVVTELLSDDLNYANLFNKCKDEGTTSIETVAEIAYGFLDSSQYPTNPFITAYTNAGISDSNKERANKLNYVTIPFIKIILPDVFGVPVEMVDQFVFVIQSDGEVATFTDPIQGTPTAPVENVITDITIYFATNLEIYNGLYIGYDSNDLESGGVLISESVENLNLIVPDITTICSNAFEYCSDDLNVSVVTDVEKTNSPQGYKINGYWRNDVDSENISWNVYKIGM